MRLLEQLYLISVILLKKAKEGQAVVLHRCEHLLQSSGNHLTSTSVPPYKPRKLSLSGLVASNNTLGRKQPTFERLVLPIRPVACAFLRRRHTVFGQSAKILLLIAKSGREPGQHKESLKFPRHRCYAQMFSPRLLLKSRPIAPVLERIERNEVLSLQFLAS